MTNLHFRQAKPSEGQELTELALRSKAHWKYSEEYLAGCRSALTIDENYIENWPVIIGERSLTEKNLETVGFFALKNVDSENRLDHLWLEPNHIGNGHGRVFFQKAVELAKNLHWDSFRLAADPPAEGFYKKMGMTRLGEIQSRIKPDLFLPHMELRFS